MRWIYAWLFLSAALPVVGQSPSDPGSSGPDQRPNILFICTDDQAPWAMGNSVADGWFDYVPAAMTPHMDRLAKEGVRFRNFFTVTPVCSPARVAMLTGHYASQFGVTDFIPSTDHKLFDPDHQVGLDPDRCTSFAEVLQDSGYHTGLVGKMHVGDWTLPGNQRFHPTQLGFDYFMGLPSGGTSPKDPVLEVDGVVSRHRGLTTDILADHAIDFIEKASGQEDPFLLCWHTRAPHGAWLPVAPEDWAPYESMDPELPDYPGLDVQRTKRRMREYLASTSGVDRNLGRILGLLDTLGIADRTVVIFTSDHGYNMGHNGIEHKGNGIWATKKRPPGPIHHGTRVISDKYRPNMYDLSLRVPAIVRWPGVVQPGTTIESTATCLDWFPTLVAMAKSPMPAGLELPGRDLTSLMTDGPPADWDNDLFAEYHMVHYAQADMVCFRTPDYKLIRDRANEGRDEFFDLRSDPDESVNLISDPRPHIQTAIAKLSTQLENRLQRLQDQTKGSNP
ncbi:Choline-sulfatase [Rubripirellula lacrimiformis]|uniref:Choline-sulfatase n=1 Tax=Rubripirellula lacrimiformis TaxID=1930273 RepID=A0A517NKI3_9BACT|nr:sulfatase-like hydrolase/transferase [Rubripirellula lacrimiformis]QDT07589.1 Choline-sulfatase [Rubripirellula lacrimiformis]